VGFRQDYDLYGHIDVDVASWAAFSWWLRFAVLSDPVEEIPERACDRCRSKLTVKVWKRLAEDRVVREDILYKLADVQCMALSSILRIPWSKSGCHSWVGREF